MSSESKCLVSGAAREQAARDADEPAIPRTIRSRKGIRLLIGLGIVTLGSARMCYLAWPLAVDVLNSTLQQFA